MTDYEFAGKVRELAAVFLMQVEMGNVKCSSRWYLDLAKAIRTEANNRLKEGAE